MIKYQVVMKPEPILDAYFGQIPDPRIACARAHQLVDIITIG
jgi:hypothetical protein